MLGNRLKNCAIVFAALAVIMMAVIMMPKEVHADDVMHITVTTNTSEALTRVVAYCHKRFDEPTSSNQAQMTTAPLTEDGSKWIDLSWEYPSNTSPQFTMLFDYKKDDYVLTKILWNDIDLFMDSDYNEPANGYYEQRFTDPYTFRVFSGTTWDDTDDYAWCSSVWGPEGGYQGNYASYVMGCCYNGDIPSLDNNIQLIFISKADITIVDEVKKAIEDLPEALSITLEDKEDVTTARTKYNALTAELRSMVPEETLKKLQDAEKMIGLYDQIAQANADKDQALADLSAANKALEDAEAELILAKDDKDKAEKDLAKAEADLKDAQDALVQADKDLKQADKDKEDALSAKEKAEENLKTALGAKETAEKNLKAANDAKEKAEKDLKDAQDAKDKAEKDLKDAQDAKDKAEADLKDVKDAKDKVEAELKVAQDAKEKAEADKAAAEQALSEAQNNSFAALAKASLGKVKGAKKKLTVNWTAVADAEGYEIIVAKNKACSRDARTYTVKNGSVVKKTIKKLKKGKYFVRVRAYKELNGNTVCGAFSKAKKVRVK